MKTIKLLPLLLLSLVINAYCMEESSTSNVPSLKDLCTKYVKENTITTLAKLKKDNLPLDLKDKLVKEFIEDLPIFQYILQHANISIANQSEAWHTTKPTSWNLLENRAIIEISHEGTNINKDFSRDTAFHEHYRCPNCPSASGTHFSTSYSGNTKSVTRTYDHTCDDYEGNLSAVSIERKENNDTLTQLFLTLDETLIGRACEKQTHQIWDLGKLIELHKYLHNITFEQTALLDDVHQVIGKKQKLPLDEYQTMTFNTLILEVQELLLPHVQLQEELK